MALKNRPIFSIKLEKEMKDTGQAGKPFYTKICETKYYRLFGILIAKVYSTGNFPDPEAKK